MTPPLRILLALSLAAAAVPVAGQLPAVSDQISVDLVNVEVHVVDAQGRPVAGLPREAFRLTDDGRDVEISHFAWVTPASERGAPAASAEPRRVTVFFDELQVGEHNRRPLLDALRDQLGRGLDDSDLVSVVRFDGANLDLLLDGASDRRRLDRVLDELSSFSLGQLVATQELRSGIEIVRQTIHHDKQTCVGAGEAVRAYADVVKRQVEASASALLRVAHRLAAAPGRRLLLHVSGGVPMTAGLEVFEWAAEMCDTTAMIQGVPDGQAGLFEFSSGALDNGSGRWNPRLMRMEQTSYSNVALWRDLAARVNALGITVYPILFGDPEERFRMEMAGVSTLTPSAASTARQNSRQTLEFLADATGGLLVDAERDTAGQLARLLADLGGYYSLAFTPATTARIGVHAIRAEVAREDVRVRHRQSYRLQSRDERVVLQLGEQFGAEHVDNPLRLALELRSAEGSPERRLRLVVPFAGLSMLDSPAGGQEGRFTVYIALSRDGDRLQMPRQHSIVARRSDPAALAYTYEVDLPGDGWREVMVAVADDYSGTVAFARQRPRER